MKTKKLLALLLTGALSVSMLAGCGSSNGGTNADADKADQSGADASASSESDLEYVKGQGKLVIGITDFAADGLSRRQARISGSALTPTWPRPGRREHRRRRLNSSRSIGTIRSWSWIPRALTPSGTA